MKGLHTPFRSPIFWRILISFCAATLLVMLLAGWLTTGFIHYLAHRRVDWSALADTAEHVYDSGGRSALDDWIEKESKEGIEVNLYEDGQSLHKWRVPSSVRHSLPASLADGRSTELRLSRDSDLVIRPVIGDDGHTRELVGYTDSRGRLSRDAQERLLLGMQMMLSLLLIGAIGWWIARRVSRPVDAIRDATRKMAEGDLAVRVQPRWSDAHDELGQLARDFNGMGERIEQLVAHERGVLQDLSHEIRSPLTRLHLLLNLAERYAGRDMATAYFRRAEQEIERMDRMTSEMLALSRLEAGLPGMEQESIDLADLAEQRVKAARVEAQAKSVAIQTIIDGSVQVKGSGILLERAMDNVITNAIKFSPADGKVEVTVGHQGNVATIKVADNGPGVPQDELGMLFRPFFRGGNAKLAKGNGLGLSIVQRVMQVHLGHVDACNRLEGGLEVTLEMPAS
ncbi:sensor histidine kinase [Dyella caseinilytica]|uniref:histidine kinase n=1 Tax=Dyella caseinilytica TaxID=1849581 RepID=A0ABX7GYR7_9GAMM|nr:HAMP domain-containing sensor histidine kinase [Dyella caseinilytica]QRN55646.1 HAMP domain-containing histidine kinase [Dyella caseinilytica]GGA03390.1 sensor histidine kinase [Dyella caseinilytica]